MAGRDGTCTYCKRRRQVHSIGRTGGGTYRRGSRRYWSSICTDCAASLLKYAGTHAGATASRYDAATLGTIAALSDDPAERAAGEEWNAKYKAARDERIAERNASRTTPTGD